MQAIRHLLLKPALLALVAGLGAWLAYDLTSSPSGPPSIEEYLANKPGRTRAPAGFAIAGMVAACAKAELVLDSGLDDVAAAHPGFIILNPRAFERLPDVVKRYAFAHECGHQLHGVDEETADCYAVTRGEAQGWLDAAGVEAICEFWKPYAGDSVHLPGPERCASMRRCFARAKASRG